MPIPMMRRYWAERLHLWREQKCLCCWCQRRLRFRETTLEHLLPVSAGGGDDMDNLAVACKPCNGLRGEKTGVPYKGCKPLPDVARRLETIKQLRVRGR